MSMQQKMIDGGFVEGSGALAPAAGCRCCGLVYSEEEIAFLLDVAKLSDSILLALALRVAREMEKRGPK